MVVTAAEYCAVGEDALRDLVQMAGIVDELECAVRRALEPVGGYRFLDVVAIRPESSSVGPNAA